jgi:hypothetical protein
MGGFGSGRHWDSRKATTFEYWQLDVRRWQRDGLLLAGRSFGLQWTQSGEVSAFVCVQVGNDTVFVGCGHRTSRGAWQSEPQHPVRLQWTPCNFGGRRAWFRCPARGCGRRVAMLYSTGGIFACRHCYRLAYDSQRQPAHDRALYRAQAIRERLGGSGNMTLPFPKKPKRMHWRTYLRLLREYERAQWRSWPPWLLKRAAAPVWRNPKQR